MHEGLELLRISGLSEWQFGAVLAITVRGQGMGGTVRSILTSLESSAEVGSSLARNVLASYAAADQSLKQMAGAKHQANPGGG